MEEGYVEPGEVISYWMMQKRILHSIYKFAIKVCRNSFKDCTEMDLEQFIDYMCFELEVNEEDDDSVSMDDDW